MEIPFCKPSIDGIEISAVAECMRSGWLTMGPKVSELEREFAIFCDEKRPGVAVDSCTSALFLCLKVLGAGPGTKVAVPTLTFAATANVVEAVGAEPVFVDVYQTGCIDPDDYIIETADIIIAVNYAGNPVDIEGLKKYNKPIIVDAAESHGVHYWSTNSRSPGAGVLSCYSFYPTKILAGAEGGMIVGQNEEQESYLKKARLHGLSKGAENRYTDRSSAAFPVVELLGYKMNMSDISATIILEQLKKYTELVNKRWNVVNVYDAAFEYLEDYLDDHERDFPIIMPREAEFAPYIYVIWVEQREKFLAFMLDKGIKCGVHFIPLHLHPYYKKNHDVKMYMSELIGEGCVSLPLYPDLSDSSVEYIIEAVYEFFEVGYDKV